MFRIVSFFFFLMALLISAVLPAEPGEIRKGIEIKRYEINAAISDDCSAIDVTALITLENNGIFPYPDPYFLLGKNFKGARFDRVECFDRDKKPIKSSFNNNILYLEHLIKGETSLRICYRITETPENSRDTYGHFAFRLSPEECHINAAITRTDSWFPRLQDAPVKALPPFELTIDGPDRFEVMASGQLVSCTRKNAGRKFLWKNYQGLKDRSLYFFAADLEKKRVTFPDGFILDLYAPAKSRDDSLNTLAETVHKSYCFFEKTFSPAPCREYKIMAFAGGYSGLCNSMTAPVSLFTEQISNNDMGFPLRTVVHEVSHTWWGNLVVPDASKDYWLFEGFAKYSEIIALKPALGLDVERESFRRLKALSLPYIDCAPSVQGANKAPERILQSVSAYYRGALFLRMVQFIMGPEQFSAGIKDYVQACRDKTATTGRLRAILDGRSGTSLKEIFSGYLEGDGFARYTLAGVGGRLDEKKKIIIDFLHFSNTGHQPLVCDVEYRSTEGKERGPLSIKSGEGCMFEAVRGYDDKDFSIAIDPDGVFPVVHEGLKGCGGMAMYEGSQVRLRDIIKGTPMAKAGIKDGDMLLEIDDKAPPQGNICTLNNLLQRNKGSVMTLTVEIPFKMKKTVKVNFGE
ncbi:MAG: M1 family aminopeptidase [Vulcanimicrobiota bacterium]